MSIELHIDSHPEQGMRVKVEVSSTNEEANNG